MALRRPPTRVELKADDIEEYNEIMREREMAMEDSNSTDATKMTTTPGGTIRIGKSTGGSSQRKPSAAERIGISRPR